MFLRNICKIPYNLKEFNTLRAMSNQSILRKPRYDGRCKKRKWEDRRTDKAIVLNEKREKTEERIKRRKYALLLGYSGVDYFGMQRNPTMKTIEEELFKALLGANFITEDAFKQVQTIQFQRAARTDKGVSAARQVVSIKLPENFDPETVNELLPAEIRVFGCKRVTKGFNSKSQCDARTYLYLLPTIAFSKSNEDNQEIYRVDEPTLGEISDTLNKFIGSKNYHNFTSKKKPNDPSANRYIMAFHCEPPFINSNVEFVVLKVRGQSFMLHQIRKMVGLTIAIVKGYASEEIFNKAFTTEKVNIPKAPGLGLVLDFVHYDRYNRRYGEDGVHETLEWQDFNSIVQEFKEKYIYPIIVDTETKDKSMVNWLTKLSTHNYDGPEEEEKNNGEIEYSDDEDNVGNSIA